MVRTTDPATDESDFEITADVNVTRDGDGVGFVRVDFGDTAADALADAADALADDADVVSLTDAADVVSLVDLSADERVAVENVFKWVDMTGDAKVVEGVYDAAVSGLNKVASDVIADDTAAGRVLSAIASAIHDTVDADTSDKRLLSTGTLLRTDVRVVGYRCLGCDRDVENDASAGRPSCCGRVVPVHDLAADE